MQEFDLSTPGGFLAAVWQMTLGVLSLEPQVFVAAVTLQRGWLVALTIAFLAGISDMLGQSVVLFANRVTPRRFLVSLVMSALIFSLSVLVWAGAIWLVVRFVFNLGGSFSVVLIVVALSQAPLVLGFWSLLPYLGNAIYQGVRIWSLLALVVAVKAIAGAVFWQGIIACLLGWLLVQFLINLPILRIKAIDAWLWRLMTGTKQRLDVQTMVDRLAEQRSKWIRGHDNQ